MGSANPPAETPMRHPTGRLALVCALLCRAGAAPPALPFAPDEQTLFLCHFQRGLDADVAVGNPEAQGCAELVAGGPSGSAVRLKRGLCLNPDGLRLPFAPLTYEVFGNIELDRGTLEFAVAPDFSERKPDNEHYLHYLFDARRGSSDGVVVMIDATPTRRTLMYFERPAGTEESLSLAVDVTGWQPGAWHHVAVTWEPGRRALWVDGQLAGTRTGAPERLAINDEVFRLGAVRWNDHFADALLAECRISKVVRYAQ